MAYRKPILRATHTHIHHTHPFLFLKKPEFTIHSCPEKMSSATRP